jgi:hypothetical protein
MGGSGDAPDADGLNLLFEVAPDAEVFQELRLPDSVNALQRNHGFEGVAAAGSGNTERIYVVF